MASRGSALPKNPTQTPAGNSNQMITPPPHGAAPPSYSDDEEDEYADGEDNGEDPEHLSAIRITISCPLKVKGDSNLVHLDTSASVSKIAQGVVASLKGMSMSGHGVPMIDQDGRPRPITIKASAGIMIAGSKNMIGEKAGRSVLPQATPKPAAALANAAAVKRERDGSAEAAGDLKRTRLG